MDARNFLYSSDYEMPALVYEVSGSISNIGSYATKSVTIAHKLPFTPLLIGVWSTNSNFMPSYDISNYIGGAVINGDMQLNRCGANGTNILIEGFNTSNSNKTLYYRLMAFAPPDYVGEVPNIYDTTNFMLNTDYNYPKLYKAGVEQISAGSTKTFEHGLGYIPQVKTWGPDYEGRITPLYRMNGPSMMSGAYGPTLNTTNLTIKASETGKYYYHIYGDEA